MRCGIIDPWARTATLRPGTVQQAERSVGLHGGKVDHAKVSSELAIVVTEYGLFYPREKMRYFSIRGRLYAGKAVVYAVDKAGHSIDLSELPDIRFFADAYEAEMAIEMGEVIQPSLSINGEVLWVWPQPAPPFMAAEIGQPWNKEAVR